MQTIYIIGDSTVEDGGEPTYGWGGQLARYLPRGVQAQNHAAGGRSSKSFWDEGRLIPVVLGLKAGDLLLIAFGHNDKKDDAERHTDPETTFPETLSLYVNAAEQAGAAPVLLTSVCRRYFTGDNSLLYTHGEYPRAVRELAARRNVPLIDLKKLTRALLTALGPERSKALFAEGDNTHFNLEGARRVAEMVAEALLAMGLIKTGEEDGNGAHG